MHSCMSHNGSGTPQKFCNSWEIKLLCNWVSLDYVILYSQDIKHFLFSGILQALNPSPMYCQLFPRQRIRTCQNWLSGLLLWELQRMLGDIFKVFWWISILVKQSIPHTHILRSVLLSIKPCWVGTPHQSCFSREDEEPLCRWAPSAIGCPACCCIQEQEGTIGRLCIGWFNTSISYLPLYCNPQPSSLLQTGCAAWWLTVQMQLKGRHGVSAGHAVEVRAVLQFSYFPVCQLHTSGMFELELWLCTGTEEMLCIWKSDIQYFVCVSSKSASTQAKMLLKTILLTGCFQDFPYSFALFFVSSLNLEALEL